MNITSYSELTWILMHHVPRAYEAFLKGTLESTTSWKHSDPFFYFSPKHITTDARVTYTDSALVYNLDWTIPGTPPPYRAQYEKNDTFKYDKPVIVINNKYITEWGNPPINYISVLDLDAILNVLIKKYTVIYIRSEGDTVGYWNDSQKVHHLDDYLLLAEKYPMVITLKDIMRTSLVPYNELQMHAHSIADKFISVAGGNAVLSSYFGGTNVIWKNKDSARTCGRPIWNTGSHLSKLSGCEIIGTNTITDLLNIISTW